MVSPAEIENISIEGGGMPDSAHLYNDTSLPPTQIERNNISAKGKIPSVIQSQIET